MDTIEQTDDSKTRQWRLFGMIFAGVVVLLVAGYLAMVRFDYRTLYSGLPIEDAALVTEELERQDIRYRLDDGGSSIAVPARQIDDIRLALYSADGPARGLSGFELFNESEMGLTDFAQKIKFQRAIQGELSRTLMMIDGVARARVHIAIPERSVFRSRVVPTKAAVTLMAREGRTFGDDTILGVQRLVASSVPGLELRNVTVLDGEGWIISKASAVFDDGGYRDVMPSQDRSGANAVTVEASLETEVGVDEVELAADTSPEASAQVASVESEDAVGAEVVPSAQDVETAQAQLVAVDSTTLKQPSAPHRQASDMASVFPVVSMFSAWAWLAVAAAMLLIALGVGIVLRRDRLSRAERKAFAAELSNYLPQFDAEVRHG